MSKETISIISVGSCDAQSRLGYYEASISSQGQSTYYTADLADTTTNRCIIQGLIDCVKTLNAPSKIVFTINTKIGSARRQKCPNKDLLQGLDSLLKQGFRCKLNS